MEFIKDQLFRMKRMGDEWYEGYMEREREQGLIKYNI